MAKKEKKQKVKEKNKSKQNDARIMVPEAADLALGAEEIKRLNRIVGQIEGIKKMVEGSRGLEDVLTQCKAVHSALRGVENRLLERHLDQAIGEIERGEKKKQRAQYVADLKALYRPI